MRAEESLVSTDPFKPLTKDLQKSEGSVEARTSGWLLSDLSALTPISDTGFLLLRPIKIRSTDIRHIHGMHTCKQTYT